MIVWVRRTKIADGGGAGDALVNQAVVYYNETTPLRISAEALSCVKPNPGRLDLNVYPHRVDISARFADIDPLWHLNNVRIIELYQEARISFNAVYTQEFGLEPTQGKRVLVARQSIDYLGEVQWPAVVTIGVGVSKVGKTSYSLALAMFHHEKCVGVSDAVLVYATHQGPAPIPETLRDALRKKMLPESAR